MTQEFPPAAFRSPRGRHRIVRIPFFIGRAPDCDMVIDDPLLSKKHAVVIWNGEEYELIDFKSHNGLSVNGRRVPREYLQEGDVVLLGSQEWTFEVLSRKGMAEEAPAEQAAQPPEFPPLVGPPAPLSFPGVPAGGGIEPGSGLKQMKELELQVSQLLGAVPHIPDLGKVRSGLVLWLQKSFHAEQVFYVVFKPGLIECRSLVAEPPVFGLAIPWPFLLERALRTGEPVVDSKPDVGWDQVRATGAKVLKGLPSTIICVPWSGPKGPGGALYAVLPMAPVRVDPTDVALLNLAAHLAAMLEGVFPPDDDLPLTPAVRGFYRQRDGGTTLT